MAHVLTTAHFSIERPPTCYASVTIDRGPGSSAAVRDFNPIDVRFGVNMRNTPSEYFTSDITLDSGHLGRPSRAITRLMHRSKTPHSITSSASASTVRGTAMPSAFAVLRLRAPIPDMGQSSACLKR